MAIREARTRFRLDYELTGSYSGPEVGFGEIMNRSPTSPFLDSFWFADKD